MSAAKSLIEVEVIDALSNQVWRIRLQLPTDASVAQALADPRVIEHCPDVATRAVGVFGSRCHPDRRLRDGDRIELYRPLIIDAKEARRERAAEQK